MPLAAGTRLGTYEIVDPLGAGGMGEVYRAKDIRLGRQVALKVLPETLAHDADHLARFEREARTVASLNHPNIVTLHSVEDEDGIRSLTMELVEGQSLADLVTPGGLPLTRVLDMAIAIADALAAAHERGVVHRDLKPANVMVTRDGRVKVLDFGLAKLTPAMATASDTQALKVGAPLSEAGMVAGTAPYMVLASSCSLGRPRHLSDRAQFSTDINTSRQVIADSADHAADTDDPGEAARFQGTGEVSGGL